jgi:3D (Asp-Asp-Asp) domain-containing protein/peptidoglycan hydrolase CwlO-like protein
MSQERQPAPARDPRGVCYEKGRFAATTVVRSRPLLGQAHSPSRRLVAAAATALAVLAVPALGLAGSPRSTPGTGLRAKDAALAAQSRTATLGLYSLDQQLATAQARLASLDARMGQLRAQRQTLGLQLAIVRRGAKLAQLHLGSHLRALYERGSVSDLEVLLGARSLDDALTSIENLDRIASQDRAVLREVKQTRAQLTETARTLASRASALAAATRDAAATAATLARSRSERSAFIASLAAQRRLTAAEIAAVVAQARAAQQRTQELAQITPVATSEVTVTPFTPVATVTPGGRLLTVSATGYAIHGRTATGLATGWGVAAVDPSVIPLGTHMTVPGYGEAVAADIGGSVVGATIDLWFPTVAQADAWGRRIVTVVLH